MMKRLDVGKEPTAPSPRVNGWAAGGDTGEDPTLGEVLAAVRTHLCADHGPKTCRLHVELMALEEQLSRLGPEELGRVEDVCADVPRALIAEVGALPGRLSSEAPSREIRTIMTRLRCVVDLALAEGADALSPDLMVRYARLDLAELLREVGGAFDALAKSRRVRYTVNAPPAVAVEADPTKLEIVLLNLIFNAFKHTPEYGQIHASLSEDDGDVALSVTDSGAGLGADQAEAIFDRARLNDRSAIMATDGLGLSLAHSRDLVALHGGTLSVIESAGPGATFFARLPARAPRGAAVQGAPPSLGAMTRRAAEVAAQELSAEANIGRAPIDRAGRLLVLIAEESPAIQRLLAKALEPAYATAAALDADSARRLALEHTPDLIIIDTSLPHGDGVPLLCAVRQRLELAHIPILAMTPNRHPHEHVQLLESGAQDLVRKPFHLQELMVRTRNLLETKQTRDLLSAAAESKETDIVSLAADVSRKQRELERAVAEVQVAREIAESANRVKSNFLRMVSHELKTPVTAMQLQMIVLDRVRAGDRVPELRAPLQSISRSFRKLLTTIDTTIEWARIEAGRCPLTVEEIDLGSLVAELVAELEDQAAQKSIELRVHRSETQPRPLWGDARICRIVLANVLGKAVALSEDGVVDVHVEHGKTSHRVYVRDTGPAVAARERHAMFEPLLEAGDLRWQAGHGSGLGLTVVRDIARAVGGDVWMENFDRERNTLVVMLSSTAESP